MGSLQLLGDGDLLTRGVAALLLLMSVASWVVILRKSWVLVRRGGMCLGPQPCSGRRQGMEQALAHLAALDRDRALLPLVEAASFLSPVGSLAGAGSREQQLTRHPAECPACGVAPPAVGAGAVGHGGVHSAFRGLVGNGVGIFHALTALAGVRTLTLDQVAGRWARPW